MARKLTFRQRLKQRAGGFCECGCGRPLLQPELDHFFGRKHGETFESCWLLEVSCHGLKTRNEPSAGWWLRRIEGKQVPARLFAIVFPRFLVFAHVTHAALDWKNALVSTHLEFFLRSRCGLREAVPLAVANEPLDEVAIVLKYGAQKYAARNWEKGMAWGRLLGAAMRHLTAWALGRELDAESGLPHLAHAGCCVLMLLALVKRGVGTDDRQVMP